MNMLNKHGPMMGYMSDTDSFGHACLYAHLNDSASVNTGLTFTTVV